MKFDVYFPFNLSLRETPTLARQAEDIGADGLWTAETQRHPFLPLPLVAEHTERLQFGTAIAVAFGRSPLTLAHTAWDLAEASGGRFILGLGTQIKPHIERRFGMPWPESPVAKFREQVAAIRAIWNTWQTGAKLNFRGEYFTHTLMTPFFNAGPIEHPNIPIYLAGVNAPMVRLAGEIADGFHVHPYHTIRYLREVTLPNIVAGAAGAGRARTDIQLASTVFAAVGEDEGSRAPQRDFVRSQVSFYASTPSYHPVMALHGWQQIAEQLSAMAARKRWAAMPGLVTDDMLAEFITEGTWDDIGLRLRERYAGLLDRIAIYTPFTASENMDLWRKLARAIRE